MFHHDKPANKAHACCRVPPFLKTIEDPQTVQGGSFKGCQFCGGESYIIVAMHFVLNTYFL